MFIHSGFFFITCGFFSILCLETTIVVIIQERPIPVSAKATSSVPVVSLYVIHLIDIEFLLWKSLLSI